MWALSDVSALRTSYCAFVIGLLCHLLYEIASPFMSSLQFFSPHQTHKSTSTWLCKEKNKQTKKKKKKTKNK